MQNIVSNRTLSLISHSSTDFTFSYKMASAQNSSQIIVEDNQCAIVPPVNVKDPGMKSIQALASNRESNQKQSVKSQTFPRFGEFPKELQLHIWKWYGRINANTPNIIKIKHHRERQRAQGPLQRGVLSREHLTHMSESQKAVYTVPPIFFVCTTSRVAGKELYAEEFQKVPMGDNDQQLSYYNEDKDIIYLMNIFTLQDWRYNRQTDSERRTRTQAHFAAQEPITRRINMKHLVVGGKLQNYFMWRLLGRFYDCETIMVEALDKTESIDFASSASFKDARDSYISNRDTLMGYFKNERYGPFAREDYKGKPVRPVIVKPSWDPAERTISNPVLLFRSWDPKRSKYASADLVCISFFNLHSFSKYQPLT